MSGLAPMDSFAGDSSLLKKFINIDYQYIMQ